MSGHSKWSTIKRKKGAEDAKRGQVFTRLARDIMMAAREGGDENANAKLKIAIGKAKASNMPKENIERAILRGTGGGDGAVMEEITYEGYGLDGVAYMVDVLTDNRNRTLAEIKHAFNRAGGSLASAGSVAWQFEKKGYILLLGENLDFDEVFMVAADAGADDVVNADGAVEVYTPREMFSAVEEALINAGYEIDESELRWEAKNEAELPMDKAIQNMRLTDHLEELDDVQSVASNLMITDEIAAAFRDGLMLSLGIDPGTATIGYGLVEELPDGSLQAIHYGVITTPAGMPMWERLKMIYDGLEILVKQYEPDRAGVEELFFAKNVTTAITVAQGRGVILLALAMAGIPISEYKPNMVKQSISGYGAAKKPQMQEMVRILLNLDSIPRPDDAADALAVAITDIHSARYSDLLD